MSRALTLVALLILSACDRTPDPRIHQAHVKYAQESLCNCLRTKTWLKDCLPNVSSINDGDPSAGVSDSEALHAECLQPRRK